MSDHLSSHLMESPGSLFASPSKVIAILPVVGQALTPFSPQSRHQIRARMERAIAGNIRHISGQKWLVGDDASRREAFHSSLRDWAEGLTTQPALHKSWRRSIDAQKKVSGDLRSIG